MQLTATFSEQDQTVTFNNGAVLPVNPTHNWPFKDGQQLIEDIHFHITQNNQHTRSSSINRYHVSRMRLSHLHPMIVIEHNLPPTRHMSDAQMN